MWSKPPGFWFSSSFHITPSTTVSSILKSQHTNWKSVIWTMSPGSILCYRSPEHPIWHASRVFLFANPQQVQLLLQVRDPLHQSGFLRLHPLKGLWASLVHLPLVPALQLGWYCLEEVLRHLQSMHVAPLLGEGGSAGLISKRIRGPALSGSPVGPVSATSWLPVSASTASFASVALGWRWSSVLPLSGLQVRVLRGLALPLAVSADHRPRFGSDHLR